MMQHATTYIENADVALCVSIPIGLVKYAASSTEKWRIVSFDGL